MSDDEKEVVAAPEVAPAVEEVKPEEEVELQEK